MVIDLHDEEWRDIEGYEGLYQVSNKGRVKSLRDNRGNYRERLVANCKDKRGYIVVCLHFKGKKHSYKVHRLVAKAFLSNPNNLPMINHKDEDPANNLVENLEWCTCLYNNNYGTRNERLSNSLKGKEFSDTHKLNISIGKKGGKAWNKGIPRSEATKQKIRDTIARKFVCHPIVQMSKEGEFLGVFPSVSKASKDLGIDSSTISKCCRGKCPSAYGFQWRYGNCLKDL